MKITKQDKYNQFSIENLTLARVLSIINALEYCNKKELTTLAGSQLLKALKQQEHKLTLRETKAETVYTQRNCQCEEDKLWDINGVIVCECGKYEE